MDRDNRRFKPTLNTFYGRIIDKIANETRKQAREAMLWQRRNRNEMRTSPSTISPVMSPLEPVTLGPSPPMMYPDTPSPVPMGSVPRGTYYAPLVTSPSPITTRRGTPPVGMTNLIAPGAIVPITRPVSRRAAPAPLGSSPINLPTADDMINRSIVSAFQQRQMQRQMIPYDATAAAEENRRRFAMMKIRNALRNFIGKRAKADSTRPERITSKRMRHTPVSSEMRRYKKPYRPVSAGGARVIPSNRTRYSGFDPISKQILRDDARRLRRIDEHLEDALDPTDPYAFLTYTY